MMKSKINSKNNMLEISHFYSSCKQCPRACGVFRGEKSTLGFCKESDKLKLASACLHFGEEPLVTVFGGSGTLFFTGCTLRCAFCQNYQISQNGMGSEISSEDFVKICIRLEESGAENINLVTGSHHIPIIASFIQSAKKSGVNIPFCWNSSAYESVEMLKLLEGLVSIWLPDLKTCSAILAKKLFSAEDYPSVARDAIIWMIKHNPLKIITKENQKDDAKKNDSSNETDSINQENKKEKILSGVIVRHLFLPGKFEETVDTLEWLKNHADGKAIVSLMSQYTPVPFVEDASQKEKRERALAVIENRLVSKSEDEDLRDIIDAYNFEYLFYQELSDDTSWLPDFSRVQPFSHKLAKPIWHWTRGFVD